MELQSPIQIHIDWRGALLIALVILSALRAKHIHATGKPIFTKIPRKFGTAAIFNLALLATYTMAGKRFLMLGTFEKYIAVFLALLTLGSILNAFLVAHISRSYKVGTLIKALALCAGFWAPAILTVSYFEEKKFVPEALFGVGAIQFALLPGFWLLLLTYLSTQKDSAAVKKRW